MGLHSFPRCRYGLPAPAMLSIKISHKNLSLKKCAPRQKHYKSLAKLCGKLFSILLTLDHFHSVNGLPLNMQEEQRCESMSRSRAGKCSKVQQGKKKKNKKWTKTKTRGSSRGGRILEMPRRAEHMRPWSASCHSDWHKLNLKGTLIPSTSHWTALKPS